MDAIIPKRCLARVRTVVQEHYNLNREVTEQEAIDEVVSLRRKATKGTLDDMGERLAAKLSLGQFAIEIQPSAQ